MGELFPGALSHVMKEVSHLETIRAVSLNEKVPFHCQLCGGCCRYVKDSIMLEPLDCYHLARHLRDQGEPVSGIEDVLAQYAHAAWLSDNFPIFLLNTADPFDVCAFLNCPLSNQCTCAL